MLGAFPVSSLFFSASVFAAGEVTTIYAEEVDGDSDAAENQYSADGDDYQWGEGRNLKITGFRYNNKDYDYRSVADNVVIRRVDNDQSSGERCTLFAERDGEPLLKQTHRAVAKYYLNRSGSKFAVTVNSRLSSDT